MEDDGTKTERKAVAPLLATVGLDEIGKLGRDAVRAMCKAEGLPTGGNKPQLVERLRAKKLGGGAGYVAGLTLCRICGHETRVLATSRIDQEDGTVLTTRMLQCTGPRRHRYKDVETTKGGK